MVFNIAEIRNKDKQTLNAQIEKEELGEEGLKKLNAYDTPTLITPSLYLAGVGSTDPRILKSIGVTLVINVAEECNVKRFKDEDGITEVKVIIDDIMTSNQNQYDKFHQLFKVIDAAEANNQKCLIHCMRGRSRSATIVIAYLMYKNGWNLSASYHYVKEKRNIIGPHGHLKQQLLHFELHHFKTTVNSIDTNGFHAKGYNS